MRQLIVVSSRWIAVIAAAVLLARLLGCGSDKTAPSSNRQPAQPSGPGTTAAPPSAGKKDGGGKPGANATQQQPDKPELKVTMERPTVIWPDEQGRRLVTASAREITWDDSRLVGSALDFSAKLYENGKLTATMSAPKAVVDTKSQTVTATGGVVMTSTQRKTTVKASWIKWFAKQKRAIGNGGVRIVSPTLTAEGAAFEADTAMKTFSVKDRVEGLEP